MIPWLQARRKALTAGAVAFGSTYVAVQGGGVTVTEWWIVILATATGLGLVERVRNVEAP